MAPSSRDRISVDLQGLKAALVERAQALGVSPSSLVRDVLTDALKRRETLLAQPPRHVTRTGSRVRLSLRMTREEASATIAAARRAGLSPGAFVACLAAAVPVATSGTNRTNHLDALVASSCEISTLSRNIRHLTTLLREHEFRAAQEYRPMLETLDDDLRRHLALVAHALADLRPRTHGGIQTIRARP